jgi:hypothetical protein
VDKMKQEIGASERKPPARASASQPVRKPATRRAADASTAPELHSHRSVRLEVRPHEDNSLARLKRRRLLRPLRTSGRGRLPTPDNSLRNRMVVLG